jgi:hypothetical protein
MLKRSVVYAAVLSMAVSFMILPFNRSFAGESVSAKEAVKYLDKSTYTSAQIKTFYRSLKKKTIKGTGKVIDVIKGRRGSKVTVLVTGTQSKKGYNLVIVTRQDPASELNKNDEIKYEGIFVRYHPFTVDNIDIKGTYTKIK